MKSTETSPSAHVLEKSQPQEFDVVILGGGTGSTIAAWTFAGEGKRVAVVDRKYIGGSCPNIACLPSKNIIHSAKVVDYVRRSKGRKKPLRHLIGMSEEFASGNMSPNSGRTLVAGSEKDFVWASIAQIYGFREFRNGPNGFRTN